MISDHSDVSDCLDKAVSPPRPPPRDLHDGGDSDDSDIPLSCAQSSKDPVAPPVPRGTKRSRDGPKSPKEVKAGKQNIRIVQKKGNAGHV